MISSTKVRPGEIGGLKKLQVGCGPKNLLSDWWNVDLREFDGIDEKIDATETWPYEDCLDFIYAEHFLEHLSFNQATKFLIHARNALTSRGKIRLSTPSLEWVLKTHFTFKTEKEEIIDQTWAINRAFHGWGHKFLYSREVLLELFKATGYESVKFFDYGISDTEVFKGVECHGGYRVVDGYPSVWIAEAVRSDVLNKDAKILEQAKEKFCRYVSSGH